MNFADSFLMPQATPDPRPLYREALAWTTGLIAGVRRDQLAAPTPCPEFDVRTLLGHLVAGVERVRIIGEGGDPSTSPTVVTGISDDGYGAAYRSATDRVWPAWTDGRLDADVTAPWGTVPGRVAIWVYSMETLVHGWDLATATGQPAETRPELAESVLAAVRHAIPPERRGEKMPFGPVITPSAHAGPTEKLANWSGRASS
ncbi:TIGR03086 family metal-binding protein [Rhodococcus spongiicola]|uniref:TIGR03086 family protein n=1 Tax=Rhodococcus spongiicola TaxID=2487352 RepID=A0A438B6R4_9NOCA|nr:TIGR03086 family metal-binding protein [Rhodococcus spongiicola]RVW06643.1 TIGR03086 family protein [Rhodococcus spongiicola]